MRTRIARLRLVSGAILVLLLAGGISQGHEIGTTEVLGRFSGGQYELTVIVDPETLLTRLELMTGRERTRSLPPAELERQIVALQSTYLQQCHIAFDGKAVTPRFSYKSLPATAATNGGRGGPAARITLMGAVPSGSRSFTWSYGIPFSTYALMLRNEGDSAPQTQWLEGDAESRPFAIREKVRVPSRSEVILQYLRLGFTHIIPKGLDHILFVLGIFLLTTRIRPVLAQVTAFTIAHSITLGLTIFGLVSLSPRIVEPAIALSIAYIGIENVLTTKISPWRIALVFAFGLLHGMGFAGVLAELGLPRSEFLTALVSFNVGVEIAQLTVIGTAFTLIASWARKRPWYRDRVVIPLSCLIAVTGLYWTVTRLAG